MIQAMNIKNLIPNFLFIKARGPDFTSFMLEAPSLPIPTSLAAKKQQHAVQFVSALRILNIAWLTKNVQIMVIIFCVKSEKIRIFFL